MIHNLKLATLGILSVLALIVILQNTDTVDTKLLFMTLSMPRAALLFATFVIGFVVGLLTASRLRSSKKPNTA